jgi:hypothetical protein
MHPYLEEVVKQRPTNQCISFGISKANETFPMSMSEYTSLALNSHGVMRGRYALELKCNHTVV